MLVVAAAGNDARNLDALGEPLGERLVSEGSVAVLTYPAAYSREMDHVIAVGASTREDRLAQFSAFGRQTVQILAPGVEVFSTMVGALKYGDRTGTLRGGGGEELAPAWDGTSMAAPLVSGAIAAFWSRHPEWTPLRVKSRVLQRGRGCRYVPILAELTRCGGVIDLKGLFGI
jgi:subtilisin family serine protease